MPIKEPSLSFYNFITGSLQSDIWKELESGLVENFSIDNYLRNNILPRESLENSLPLFNDFHQIISGTKWDIQTNKLKQDFYTPKRIEDTSLHKFIDLSEKYFIGLNAKKIGVHLSGGLDSSLIICLLKTLNVPFVPIGLKSQTYEFRTERKIQEILLPYGTEGRLLDFEDYPFYSQLDSIPKHQIPDAYIKSVANSYALAQAFNQQGCDVVLSGQGGDTLFVDEIQNVETLKFNIGYEFNLSVEQERIYAPLGLRLESFYANHEIIDFICSARIGQTLDPLKIWARKWSQSILPRELSEFSYYADYFGLTMWGLHEARPMIKELMEEAYDVSKFPHFSPKNVKRFLNQDVFSFEHKDYIQYCGLISVASWYHSLFNN